MKFVGVSAPAWTITGSKRTEKKQLPDIHEGLPAAPPADLEVKTNEVVYPAYPKWSFNKAKSASHGQLPRPQTMGETSDKTKASLLNPKDWRDTVHIGTRFSKANRFGDRDRKKRGNDYVSPGPGAYGTDLKEANPSLNMPNFTFAYKHDTTTGQDINPVAPNAYNPLFKHRELEKVVSFPKAKKVSLEDIGKANDIPGPGSYPIPVERPNTTSVRGTFGRSQRNDLYKNVPSCNPEKDYNVDQHTIEFKAQQVKTTFAGRNQSRPSTTSAQRLTSDNTTGGSGTENIGFNGTKMNAPKWKFGSSERPPLYGALQCDIAPGWHLGKTQSEKQFKHLAKFRTAERKPLANNQETPGVGHYDLRQKVEDFLEGSLKKPKTLMGGPLFSFRGKFESVDARESQKVPGPGQYEPGDAFHFPNYATAFIGTSMRDKAKRKDFQPGPGSYNINRELASASGIRFAKAKRRNPGNNVDPDVEIGPGQYKLKSTVPQLQCYEMQRLIQGGGQLVNLDV